MKISKAVLLAAALGVSVFFISGNAFSDGSAMKDMKKKQPESSMMTDDSGMKKPVAEEMGNTMKTEMGEPMKAGMEDTMNKEMAEPMKAGMDT